MSESKIGDWTLGPQLGKGGNARVFKATKSDGTVGALKLFYKTNKKTLGRYKSEILAMQVLSGISGVLPLLDEYVPRSHKGNNKIWFVLPVATPLTHSVSPADYISILKAVARISSTIMQMHDIGMAHRDIKPSNMLYYQNDPCVADFGLVKYPGKIDLTAKQIKVGPRQTVAPEMRYYDDGIDEKAADVYSLAKSLWMLLCNQQSCFEGQYSPRSEYSIRALAPKAHLDSLDSLIELATSHNPENRPTISDFLNKLNECIDTHEDIDKLSRAKWDSIRNFLLPELVPSRCIWTDPADISDVLHLVASSAKHNHMMLPSGGGMDLLGARVRPNAEEIELIFEIKSNSAYVVKPRNLVYEIFGDSMWDYLYLETETGQPSGLSFDKWPASTDYEEVIESSSGVLYDLDALMTGEWGSAGEPEAWRRVVRYKAGAFLIVHRRSHYNMNTATYDGRHSQCNCDQFRDYIKRLISQAPSKLP